MQNFVIVRMSSLVYLVETGVETGPHASLGAGVPCSEESPRASGLLCPNGSMAGRFLRKPVAIAAELGIV